MSQNPTFEFHFSVRHLAYAFFIALIIVGAYLLSSSGLIEQWVRSSGAWSIVAIFVGGLFFTSFSTFPLAVAIFVALDHVGGSPLLTVVLGGFGAMIGDAGLLKSMRTSFLDDLSAFFIYKTHGAFAAVMHQKLIRSLAFLAGGLMIASPIPDEVGLSLMGIAHLPNKYIMLVSLIFNCLGISVVLGLAS